MAFWDVAGTGTTQAGSGAALPSAGTKPFWDISGPTQTAQQDPEPLIPPPPESPGNPFKFLLGTAAHIVTGIPEAIKGITTLLGKTAEDVVGAVEQVIPGQQGTEAKIEEQGYNWANIIKAAPAMLRDDYASRYGFNGLDEMKDQIYANPLSYILDAFMVSGAVGTGARIGGKLGLLSDSAVTAVRGISPAAEATGKTLQSVGNAAAKTEAGVAAGVTKGFNTAMPSTEAMMLQGAVPEVAAPIGAFASDIVEMAPRTGVLGISTAYSPLKRAIQNTVVKNILSRPAEKVTGWLDDIVKDTATVEAKEAARLNLSRMGIPVDNPGLLAQARVRAAAAEAAGIPILKPMGEKFVTNRAARYIAGMTKQQFYQSRNKMVLGIQSIWGKGSLKGTEEGWLATQALMGTTEDFYKALNGMSIDPHGVPYTGPVILDHGDIPVLPHDALGAALGPEGYMSVGVDKAIREQVMESVVAYSHPALPWAKGPIPENAVGVATKSLNSPGTAVMSEVPGNTAMHFNMLIEQGMKQSDNVVKDFAEKNGYTILGVNDNLGDANTAWNELRYYLQTPEGERFSLNVADEDLFNAQQIASAYNAHIEKVTGITAGYDKEAQLLETLMGDRPIGEYPSELGLSPSDLSRVQRIQELRKLSDNVREETEATAAQVNALWRHPLRRLNNSYEFSWEEGGTLAERIDRTYLWSAEHNQLGMMKFWNPEWAAKGIKGPMTVSINRAFMPIKLETLHKMFESARSDIEDILRANVKSSRDDKIINVADYLERFHLMPQQQVKKALYTWMDEDVASAIYASKSQGVPLAAVKDMTTARLERVTSRMKEIADNPLEDIEAVEGKLINKDPKIGAQQVIDNLMEEMRMPILRGEIEGELLDAWSWKSFMDVTPDLPVYYPHIRMGSPGGLWWKGAAMKPTVLNYQKGFKGYLMESGRILDDPAAAYSLRAYQILRHEELIDQFENLRQAGRVVDKKELTLIQAGEKMLNGEVLFSPDYVKNKLSLHAMILDDITDSVKDGMLYEDAAKRSIDHFNDLLQNQTTNDIESSLVYAIPKNVADQFKSGFLQGVSPERMRLFWDKPKDLWISSVLGLNPRWFLYRMMGNVVFAGITNPRSIPRLFGWTNRKNNAIINEILTDIETQGGKSNVLSDLSQGYAAQEIQKLGLVGGKPKVLGAGAGAGQKMREWGKAGETYAPLTKRLDAIYESKWSSPFKRVSHKMTSWVNNMEQAERRGVALGAAARQTGSGFERNITIARKLADEGFDESNVARFTNEANWVLGNYTNLSPIERDVIRRFLMPFYPFYRHMLKFSLRMPWDHPGKTALFTNLAHMDDEMGPHMPEYLRGGVYIGELGGMPSYWNITRWNPIAELALPESNPITFMDPRIRTLLSAWTGTDEFLRPFHHDNVYEAPNGTRLIRTNSGWEPFEGIEHPPWSEMLMGFYGGPGASAIQGTSFGKGYNQPWWKSIGQGLGATVSQYDQQEQVIRELEAVQAAFNSPTAAQTPYSY